MFNCFWLLALAALLCPMQTSTLSLDLHGRATLTALGAEAQAAAAAEEWRDVSAAAGA